MLKKCNRFKKLEIKIIKKEKREIMEVERKNGGKKENSTELQKPNVEVEVYKNKKCD